MNFMNFGKALEIVKSGGRVARRGWNGKGMFIYLTSYSEVPFNRLTDGAGKYVTAENTGESTAHINAHIDMKAADGNIVVGWLASQTDMIAEDWIVVE